MIPAQRGEGATERDAAVDGGDMIGAEGAREDFGGERPAGRRVLGHLDQHAVARREHVTQGAEGEVEGKVPGGDDPRHALGLPGDLRGTAAEGEALDAAPLGPHPATHLARGGERTAERTADVDQIRRRVRMHGEVRPQRLAQARAVVEQRGGEGVEMRASLPGTRIRVAQECAAVRLEPLLQLRDGVAVADGGGGVDGHGRLAIRPQRQGVPWSQMVERESTRKRRPKTALGRGHGRDAARSRPWPTSEAEDL